MIEKARNLSFLNKVLLTIIGTFAWIYLSSFLDLDQQASWLLTGIILAGIVGLFWGFGNDSKSNDGTNEEEEIK